MQGMTAKVKGSYSKEQEENIEKQIEENGFSQILDATGLVIVFALGYNEELDSFRLLVSPVVDFIEDALTETGKHIKGELLIYDCSDLELITTTKEQQEQIQQRMMEEAQRNARVSNLLPPQMINRQQRRHPNGN